MKYNVYIRHGKNWYKIFQLGTSILDWHEVNVNDTCEHVDGRIGVIIYKNDEFFTVDFNPNDGQGYHRLQVFRGYEYNQWFKRIGKYYFN